MIWEYQGPQAAKPGETENEDILLEMERLLYEDLREEFIQKGLLTKEFINLLKQAPDVHDMDIHLSKMFELKWGRIEKKLASIVIERHVEVDRADSKRRKTPPVDCSEVSTECVRPTESVKPKMTFEEKESFENCLASLNDDQELPPHIIDLL
ncbi:hypothetical protein ABZP36_002211 [Zizania latifolia]